ncbi:MAG: hypothetical protein CMC82_01945 [Flavobacteriaceae bacterium]|nr:hypothetical protein [Flavobacteriaceae bacterium]|tara:strand:- start:226 stop:1053 length:828 start_codon:yes stop_codon:yes gene_type:complete
MSTIDKTGIQTGQTIEAAQILGIIEALDGTNSSDIIINGKLNVDNNLTITGNITGSDLIITSSNFSVLANGSGNSIINLAAGTETDITITEDQKIEINTPLLDLTNGKISITGSVGFNYDIIPDRTLVISGSGVTIKGPAELTLPSGSGTQDFGVSGAYQVSWDATVTQNFFEDDFIRLNWDNSGQYSLAIMQDPSNGQVNIINNEEGTYTHFNAEVASGGVFISEILENSSNSTTLKAPRGGTSFPFYKILIVHSDSAVYGVQNMYAIIEKLIN